MGRSASPHTPLTVFTSTGLDVSIQKKAWGRGESGAQGENGRSLSGAGEWGLAPRERSTDGGDQRTADNRPVGGRAVGRAERNRTGGVRSPGSEKLLGIERVRGGGLRATVRIWCMVPGGGGGVIDWGLWEWSCRSRPDRRAELRQAGPGGKRDLAVGDRDRLPVPGGQAGGRDPRGLPGGQLPVVLLPVVLLPGAGPPPGPGRPSLPALARTASFLPSLET